MNANYNLRFYPLPNAIVATLKRVDATADRLIQKGESVPNVIGLTRGEFNAVDTIVQHVSSGRVNARKVTWNGRSLVSLAA